ncbi:MAG: hypothetical protein ACI3Y0_12175 [Prevotella sp.]
MKKKEFYVTPKMTVYNVETCKILAGSGDNDLQGGEYGDGTPGE